MRAVMISDAHVEGDDDPRGQELVEWLDALAVDRVFLLGDIAHTWWPPRGLPLRQGRLCDALGRLAGRGTRLAFLPGNHDFFAESWFRELGAEILSGPALVEVNGLRFALGHGDEADRTLGYGLTRRVLRGRPFRAALGGVSPERASDFLRRLAGGSRAHPVDADVLAAAQLAWARSQLDSGADVVVVGHSHVPADLELDSGRYVNLGSWTQTHSWLEVEGSRVELVVQA